MSKSGDLPKKEKTHLYQKHGHKVTLMVKVIHAEHVKPWRRRELNTPQLREANVNTQNTYNLRTHLHYGDVQHLEMLHVFRLINEL